MELFALGLLVIVQVTGQSFPCTHEFQLPSIVTSCQAQLLLQVGTIYTGTRARFENICRTFDSEVAVCINERTSGCRSEIKAQVPELIAELRGRYCEPGTTQITAFVRTNVDFIAGLSVTEIADGYLSLSLSVTLTQCILRSVDILTVSQSFTLATWARYYAVYYQCIRVQLTLTGTSDGFRSLWMFHLYTSLSVGIRVEANIFTRSFVIFARALIRFTAHVVGDPHTRNKKGDIITCGSKGNTLFLRNKFVDITGVNTEASPGSEATYLSEVSIGLRDSAGVIKTSYEAGDSKLPTEFVGGGVIKFEGTEDEVSITEIDSGKIRIVYGTGGTTILLSRTRHIYALVVRAADELLQESYGLLVDGCEDEEIDISAASTAGSEACKNVNETLRTLCEYDYMVTGDAELSASVNVITELEKGAEELDDALTDNGHKILFSPYLGTIALIVYGLQ